VSESAGYNELFMGEQYRVGLPTLIGRSATEALNGGEAFPFMHFSLVMNQSRKFLLYGANNVDGNRFRDIKRSNSDWHFDARIGVENQVGNEFYHQNSWDRGHMVRRRDVCWGSLEQAEKGNYDSFCWANIVLQDKKLNQGVWNEIEDWMTEIKENESKKLSIFTGPIFTTTDQEYCGTGRELTCGIQIPAGFWKVVFFVNSSKELHSAAFIVKQDERWSDPIGGRLKALENYQVPLRTISNLTDILFEEELYQTNPLFQEPSLQTLRFGIETPERNIIRQKQDLIIHRNDYE